VSQPACGPDVDIERFFWFGLVRIIPMLRFSSVDSNHDGKESETGRVVADAFHLVAKNIVQNQTFTIKSIHHSLGAP
jgi:hypothetical protein